MVGVTASPLLSGIVKSVPSGDTIVVMKQAAAINGPPPEMRLNLSSVRAPLLSRDMRSDEPCAWSSREALRKRLIGRTVSFRIDYRVTSLSRIFATVYPTPAASTPSVNLDMAELGHVRVRKPATPTEEVSPELDSLIAAEERAQLASLGLHSSSPSSDVEEYATPRHVVDGDMVIAEQLVTATKKPLHAVIEYVATGSIVKAFVRGVPIDATGSRTSDRLLTLSISGIQCPGFRRTTTTTPSSTTDSTTNDSKPTPMPYAANARFLTEVRLLHRDVMVTFDGADRNDIILASIEEPNAKMYVAEELLRAGMAKTVSWSLDKTSRAPALRAAEQYARKRQVGLWKGVAVPQANAANSQRFVGKVIEVVSGDMLAIADESTATVKRITLASVRAPRAERSTSSTGRDRSTMPTGPTADAKEALRKKVIGRRVHVKVEYTREPSADAVRKEVMVFATVSREGGHSHSSSSSSSEMVDIALSLISAGHLSVVRHRGDEERAANYEEYLTREQAAISTRKGMHAPNAVNSGVRINNLTGPDAKRRSRDVLAGLQRNGPYRGLVEYVTSASRFRVFLQTESMLITLALRAVRCPNSTRRIYAPDGTIREETPGEELGDEAAEFTKERVMQREVEVDIHNVDRVGAFLGNISVIMPSGEKVDVSAMLLASGFGYMHESFDPTRDRLGAKYTEIENEARSKKMGVWLKYDEGRDEQAAEDGTNNNNSLHEGGANAQNGGTTASSHLMKSSRSTGGGNGPLDVKKRFKAQVCDIGFGGKMFVQECSDASAKSLASIERALADLNLDGSSSSSSSSAAAASAPSGLGKTTATVPPLASLKIGDSVIAKYSADARWYRARVQFVHRQSQNVDVRFMDYGNEERVSISNVRKLAVAPAPLRAAPIAQQITLAHVIVPDEDDACGMAAGEMLRDLVYNRVIEVCVSSVDVGGLLQGDILITMEKEGEEEAKDKVEEEKDNGEKKDSNNNNSNKKKEEISIREEMLKSGLARLIRKKKDRTARHAYALLRPLEEIGIRSRQFLWNYGEAFESDCDDEQANEQ